MSSNIPIFRQFSWVSLLPQILVIILLALIASVVGLNDLFSFDGIIANILWGSIGQLAIWIFLKNTIMKSHKDAITLVKQEKFTEAIPLLKDSYETFSKHSWFDKYRYFLGSNSNLTYKEMDLNNIAFCYSQIGDKENAIFYYEKALSEFPDSALAKVALTFIKTMSSETKT
jgi:tetratricopeptide (TPR) repeat protein